MAIDYVLAAGRLLEIQHPATQHSALDQGELLELAQQVFSFIQPDDFRWRIANMPNFSCFVARQGDNLVGFKLGYAIKSTHYYSWLGGVHPNYLRRGIATALMRQQHDWLRTQGFLTVETGTQASNDPMRQLNLASGFAEAGWFEKPRGREITYLKYL